MSGRDSPVDGLHVDGLHVDGLHVDGLHVDGLHVDGNRLWQRIIDLGEIGAVLGPNGEHGCARLALTDADGEGRRLVLGWMRDLGLEISVDVIGNVVGTRPGSDPDEAAVMTGSHIDTVRTGGRFDGNLGVLAGLEVIETLEQFGIVTKRAIQVAFFTDEEGARFAPDMLGSLVSSAVWRSRRRSMSALRTTERDSVTNSAESASPGSPRVQRQSRQRLSSSCTSSRGRCSRRTMSRSVL
jgi:hydantoinase/carbamoylase family amidase